MIKADETISFAKPSAGKKSAIRTILSDQMPKVAEEQIVYIPIDLLDDLFSFEHSFEKSLKSRKGLAELAESIRLQGILQPIIVRPSLRTSGRYEIIAGHRRKAGAVMAELTEVPSIIRACDDDDAKLIVGDNLFQREEILPSEKAKAYKMRMEVLRRKAGRPTQENYVQSEQNFLGRVSRDILAEETGDTASKIQRYLRLNELIDPLLDMVDDKELGLIAAVDLSYLQKQSQEFLYELIAEKEISISGTLAKELRYSAGDMILNKKIIEAIIDPPGEVPEKIRPTKPAYVKTIKSIEKGIKKLPAEKMEKLAMCDDEMLRDLEQTINSVIDDFINNL